MSRLSDDVVLFADLRGGRNDSDSPLSLESDQCVEALNVDWFEGTLARKRGGSAALSTTFSSGGPFTGVISSILRHVPAVDETAAELFAADAGVTPVLGRLAAAATWVAVTLTDAFGSASAAIGMDGVSFGGFLTLLYDTAQNRSHCWDASLSKVRREGLATPGAAPTGADDGGGALSLTRSYRVRFVDVSGSDVRRMSEASAILTRTIAAKAGSTITRPTAASEDETHWDLEASDATTGPWYRIARTAIATTTFDDTNATIPTTNLSPSDGIFFPPPSAKYAVRDQARKLYAGAYETSGGYVTPKNNRVWWTPPSGSLDIGDGERIPTGYSIDVEQAITGLGGPLSGDVFVFAYRAIWGLTPTTLTGANAYRRYTLRTDIGCIRHQTIVSAEDENGNPCLYFLSHKGPYRIGPNGVQYLGNDIETLWGTINLGATGAVAHGVYHSDKHQVWWWIATGSSNDPDVRIIFDTRLGKSTTAQDKGDAVLKGWAKHTGGGSHARCSVMFSNTVGATMSRDLKPYIGQVDAVNTIWKCDTGTDDAGATFQAYVETRPAQPGGYGFNHSVQDGELYAKAQSGVTITVTPLGSSGLESGQAGIAVLTASAAGETRVIKRVEGLQLAGHAYIAFRIGDAAVAGNGWTLDAYRPFMSVQEARG